MSGHPSAADLIDAVRDFLAEIEPTLVGRDSFHAKVAGNVLGLVARELRLRPEQAEHAALARVLGYDAPLDRLRSDACDALRERRLSADTPGLLDELIGATLAKLAADNPRHSTFLRLTEKP